MAALLLPLLGPPVASALRINHCFRVTFRRGPTMHLTVGKEWQCNAGLDIRSYFLAVTILDCAAACAPKRTFCETLKLRRAPHKGM